MVALRVGKWKLIEAVGGLRDGHWYHTSRTDALNSTDSSSATRVVESLMRWMEGLTTPAKFDTIKDIAVHLGVQASFRSASLAEGDSVMLFDIEADPLEMHNLAREHPDVVARLQARAKELADARPVQQ